MTGKEKNTVYRRKRKGNPSLQFRYTRKKWRKRPPIDGEIPEATPGISVNSFHQIPKILNRWVHLYEKLEPEDYLDGCSECSDDKTACLGEGYSLTDLKKQWRNCLQHCPKLMCARKVRNIDVEREPVYYLCQIFPHSLLFIRRSIYCRLNYVHLF